MSSDEDFSLISGDSEWQRIQTLINNCKRDYESFLNDQKMLKEACESNLHYANEFDQRAVSLRAELQAEEMKQKEALAAEEKKIFDIQEEQQRLKSVIQSVQKDIQQMEEANHYLRQQSDVSTAVPERKVVFKGQTSDGLDFPEFDIKPSIVYPMEGGTALITFEDEAVAQNILKMMDHEVKLDSNVIIKVQSLPVHLLVPSFVELDTQVCPRRILVSNLPKMEGEVIDRLLDKLEIYFSKKKNGGGEVEETEMLPDSGNVVITFLGNDIAKGLTDKQDHEVEMERGKRHKVKVTPFLNGSIADLQTREMACQRSVLLTGIPDIMDPDSLQDLLEIHFQKTSNGGGEVDNIIYNPVGKQTMALFDEDSSAGNQSL